MKNKEDTMPYESEELAEKEINEKYGYSPFDPFVWNRYYLSALQKGTTQSGREKHTFIFRHLETDEPVFFSIMYDEKGRMMFASQANKVLNALVQNNEKTIAEAIRRAKGNRDIVVYLKCDMDGKYINVADAKKMLSNEDKMNDEIKAKINAQKIAGDDDDDLPI